MGSSGISAGHGTAVFDYKGANNRWYHLDNGVFNRIMKEAAVGIVEQPQQVSSRQLRSGGNTETESTLYFECLRNARRVTQATGDWLTSIHTRFVYSQQEPEFFFGVAHELWKQLDREEEENGDDSELEMAIGDPNGLKVGVRMPTHTQPKPNSSANNNNQCKAM